MKTSVTTLKRLLVGWTVDDTGLLRKPAGTICSVRTNNVGYRRVCIEGKFYFQHRIIFLLVNGYLPEQVDHINRVRDDNRPSNLRGVTNAQNCQNKRPETRNTSGTRGVSYVKATGKWCASITVLGETKTARFDTKEQAVAQRILWEQEIVHGTTT